MFFLRLFVVGAMLASCGGGSSAVAPVKTPVNTSFSLSGVVIDGYMNGATVFIDRNNNGVQDATEPFAVTGTTGAFQLTGLKIGDENYPIVADVPATATDSDTGRRVGQHSIMNTPAPGILTQTLVISPITTLIKTVMDSTPNSDRYTAAQSIKTDLALSPASTVDLFANYVKLETNSADYAKVHRVAQVVARTVARQADLVYQSAVKNNAKATFSDAISLITNQVVNQLPVIEKAIPVGTPSVVGLAWDAYTHSIAVADTYTAPINLRDTYTFNPAVNHQIQLTSAARQKAQALVANTSIQAALVLQDAYVQVVAQDAYSLALAMLQAPKVTQAQVSVATQSLTVASANQSTVVVRSAPLITLKGAAVQTVAQGSVFIDAGSTVTDNVDKNLGVTVTGKVNTAVIGTYPLTYTAKDKAGNIAVPVIRTVNVTDQTAPVVTLKGAAVQTVAQGSVFIDAGSTVTDNVDKNLVVTVTGKVNIAVIGTYTLTYTAKDKAGNTAVLVTRTVHVTDQTSPVITLKGAAVQTVAQASVFTDAGSTVTDNVDKGLTAIVTGAVNTALVGSYVLKYTAKDTAGNIAIAVKRTVNVTDQSAPIITLTGANPLTVAQGTVFTDAGSTVTDNVDKNLVATVKGKVNAALIGTYTLTYTAKDKAGNAAIAVKRTVNVTDQTAPVVTAPTSITVVAVNANGTLASNSKISAFLIAATAKDNVDATSIVTHNTATQFPLGLTTVIFTSVDKAGNQGTATATVNVTDQTAPIVTAPASITVAAVDARGTTTSNAKIAAFLAAARGSDNIDVTSIVTHNAPFRFSLGVTTVTFRSIDKAGNQGVATATVTVGDQTAPIITLTGANPLTVGQGKVFTDPSSTVTDNVDKNLVATVTGKVNTAVIGTYTLTYTAKDKAGNAAIVVTRTVKVTDQTSPVITLKGAVVQTVGQGSVFIDAGSTVTDNVDKNLIATVTGKVNTALIGSYTLTYKAKDKAGNAAIVATRTVKVTDQIAPVITLKGAAVQTVAQASVFTDAGSTVTDNVDKGLTAIVTGAVNTALVGSYVLKYTAKDTAGNAAIAVKRTVNVTDQTAPIITLTGSNPLTVGQGATFTDPGSTVADNVDKKLIATVTGTVNTMIVGTYSLTYTVKDKAGNAAFLKVRTVTVLKDNVPPVLTLIGKPSVRIAVGSNYKDAGATAVDNVDGNITAKIVVSNLVNATLLGIYSVTYNIKDSVGNVAIALVRTVKVTDQTAPVVIAPKPLLLTTMDTYAIAATDPYITAFLNQATATDNIDTVLTITNNAPIKFPVGVTTVTFTSIDKAGNQGLTTATVTVQGRLFVGLTTRSLLLADITAWEGKSAHKVHRIQHFYDFSAPPYLWNTEVPSMLNAGYQVVLTMEPRVGTNDGVTHLRDIYAGLMDPYIDASINGIKNNILATWPNADIWMRFGHEMNGDWYPWGSDFNQGTTVRHLGNTAQDYINAYRHVVDRFRKAGLGSNVVKWVFSPNVWYKDNFSQFYPGDAYVDMLSVSGFNFGNKTSLHPTLTWQMFNQIHQLTYNSLTTLYPTKAYFIAGISSAELGGPTGQLGVDKAAWIDDMTAQLSQGYPKLQGIFWFNENKKALGEADWRIDSSTQSLAAIQRMYVKKGLWKP